MVHAASVMRRFARWAPLGLMAVACGARTQLDFATLSTQRADPSSLVDASTTDASSVEHDAGEHDAGRTGPTERDASPEDAAVDAATHDASGDALDDDAATDAGSSCAFACQLEQSSCIANGVSQCTLNKDDCLDWAAATPCATGKVCRADGVRAACQPILPPRAIAPLSTATVTSQRPLLHWLLADGTDGAQVELYRDHACTDSVTQFTATGTSGAPAAPLAPGVYFWRVKGAVGANVGVQPSAVWQFFVGARSAAVNTSWGSTFDLNADGFADIVIGTPYVNSLMGAVQIQLGSSNGPLTPPITLAAPAGSEPLSEFGYSVASAGDVNGDGFVDLIVGATGAGATPGAAYVYLGGANGLSSTPTTLLGSNAHGYFGWTVSSAGDVNGDGFADVVVAPGTSYGSSFLYFGSANGVSPSATLLATPSAVAIAGAGDLNGDGFGDIVAGGNYAERDAGAAYVFLGSASGPGAALEIASPESYYGFFGYSVASAGDVNGDGFADLIVGGPGITPASYVYLGNAAGFSATPITLANQGGPTDTLSTPTSIEFGAAVSGAGDVNGDGFADVLVGCNAQNAAYLFLGGPGGSTTTPAALSGGISFGSALASVGDVNRDGFADLAVASGSSVSLYFGNANGVATAPHISTEPGSVSAL